MCGIVLEDDGPMSRSSVRGFLRMKRVFEQSLENKWSGSPGKYYTMFFRSRIWLKYWMFFEKSAHSGFFSKSNEKSTAFEPVFKPKTRIIWLKWLRTEQNLFLKGTHTIWFFLKNSTTKFVVYYLNLIKFWPIETFRDSIPYHF